MTTLASIKSFLKVLTIWMAPWVVFALVLGLLDHLLIIFVIGFASFVFYMMISKFICLWILGGSKQLQSPAEQRISVKVSVLEILSPERRVYLFKGFPWDTGVIAITTGELARAKEAQLLEMASYSENQLNRLDVYIWTWVFPAYRFFSKSQEMLTGTISAGRLILGVIWYAPFQLCRAMINKHALEFSSVDSVLENKT